MPVTTRRRTAALSAVRPSSLKKQTTTTTPSSSTTKTETETETKTKTTKPTSSRPRPLRRNASTHNNSPLPPQPLSTPPTTTTRPPVQIISPKSQTPPITFPTPIHRRRLASLPNSEPVLTGASPPSIACAYGHRLYNKQTKWGSASIVSPTALQGRDLRAQARFYEGQLARIGAELAGTGEGELWRVHGAVDLAVGMLKGVIAKGGGK